jgi:hypothetical protein
MSKITDADKKKQLTVYLPDTRGVTISRFGIGNLKIGLGVFTYSRLPGDPKRYALGLVSDAGEKKGGLPHDCGDDGGSALNGTCPGATKECQSICYAARPVTEAGPVAEMWARNSSTEDVPMELPPDAKLVRLHISGDFSSRGYIDGWFALFASRPDVRMWAYTRSWRVPELLPALDRLRSLPNVQVFASVDKTTDDKEITSITNAYIRDGREPWRLAWIDGDYRGNRTYDSGGAWRETMFGGDGGGRTLVCPEEAGTKANCLECKYCFDGRRFDVTFLKH